MDPQSHNQIEQYTQLIRSLWQSLSPKKLRAHLALRIEWSIDKNKEGTPIKIGRIVKAPVRREENIWTVEIKGCRSFSSKKITRGCKEKHGAVSTNSLGTKLNYQRPRISTRRTERKNKLSQLKELPAWFGKQKSFGQNQIASGYYDRNRTFLN